jgi:hypothetical protein
MCVDECAVDEALASPSRAPRATASLTVANTTSQSSNGPGCVTAPGRFVFYRRTFMKITVNTLKPRNPLVAHAHFRRAGSHQSGGRSMRQDAGRALKRELDQMKQRSP